MQVSHGQSGPCRRVGSEFDRCLAERNELAYFGDDDVSLVMVTPRVHDCDKLVRFIKLFFSMMTVAHNKLEWLSLAFSRII